MKKFAILIGLLITTVMLSGCDIKQFKGFGKDTIIRVNGENISKAKYDEAFEKNANNSALNQFGIDFRKDPDSYFYIANKQKVINELIFKTLLDQEMKKRKIKVTSSDYDKAYAEIVEKVGSKEKLNEILKQNQTSQATFKSDLKEELKIRKLLDTLGVVKVTDKEVEDYYKKNIKTFNYPEKVKAAHIMISADPVQIRDILIAKDENKNLSKDELDKKVKEELSAKEAKAKTILAKLKRDPSQFAQLAKENSDDVYTASQGGDLGYLSREEMPKDFADMVFKQKPNTISDLVITPYGYHIVMVSDRKAAGVEPFEKVKGELKEYLELQKKAELFQKFAQNIVKEAKIEYLDESYNPEVIDKQLKEIQKKNPSLIEANSAAE